VCSGSARRMRGATGVESCWTGDGHVVTDPNGAEFQQFYDDRYGEGYMEDWPESKKRRVAQLVEGIHLPRHGRALDFGCGQGVFARVLRQALPTWQIVGTEMSRMALRLAQAHVPSCTFVPPEEAMRLSPFDFVFTHHVLEHVLDVDEVLARISAMAAPRALMLHILPCGNPGSFEHSLASRVTEGIRSDAQDRFFFEDEGHLRRLTSAGLVATAERHGWTVKEQLFANHFWGAVEWITALDLSFVRQVASPAQALTRRGAAALLACQVSLAGVQVARRVPGLSISGFLKQRAEAEWARKRSNPAGSEMYLLFQKS
jgi:SAM-dependent methyltransferase